MCKFLPPLMAVILGLLPATGVAAAAEHTADTLETVKKNLADGKCVLIDVRELNEWNDGHLKDAKHLPFSKFKGGVVPDEFAKLAPKGKIVYLHCAAGVRCLKAAEVLQKTGFDVRALKPGYNALREAGFAPADK
jgi:phage shock protein E